MTSEEALPKLVKYVKSLRKFTRALEKSEDDGHYIRGIHFVAWNHTEMRHITCDRKHRPTHKCARVIQLNHNINYRKHKVDRYIQTSICNYLT
jgi:hypothetical protein